jgi:peroxiredoxin Q/BCP
MSDTPALLSIGDRAPAFNAKDQFNHERSLEDFAGTRLLLYFYPQDDTPGCTTEACSFRDNLARLQSKGVAVIGISTDGVESHEKFAAKYALGFPLIADPDKKIVNAYGVWSEITSHGKTFHGTRRTSFLINSEGIIERVYPDVDPDTHMQEVLKDLIEIHS